MGGDAPPIPGSDEAAGSRCWVDSAGQSTAVDVIPTLEPAAPVTEGGSLVGPPADPVPPSGNPIPQKKPRKAPVRKRAIPKLGTSISKKPPKSRKKKTVKNPKTPVPPATSVDQECSTAMVTCDTDADHVDQPLAVATAKVNQYDEMTRALCPGKVCIYPPLSQKYTLTSLHVVEPQQYFIFRDTKGNVRRLILQLLSIPRT